ncbi:MAG: GNAT family N-acetyltransferase [Bacteroidetes bacterium HGW-Bacteroidetes-8]|jgi:predicted N-acetyltransferase YhbS|nr:MAG: GNAT family N-acetyltransferase [Bacteroidetes bacterium HGW-Bacteroidetes-8]
MNLIIKNTDKSKFFETENLTREAFWNLYKPGCDEHLALHQLRSGECYVPEMDLVALLDGQIVGHVISTRAKVVDGEAGDSCAAGDAGAVVCDQVLCLGPISAEPSLQGKGIGSQLMRASIARAASLGFKSIILYGNPDYYGRFGFENAVKYKIATRDNQNFDPFMAIELFPGALNGVSGRFYEDSLFFNTEADLVEFEKLFPAKEKGEPRIILPEF